MICVCAFVWKRKRSDFCIQKVSSFFFFWFSMYNFFLDKMSERNCTGVLLEMDVP